VLLAIGPSIGSCCQCMPRMWRQVSCCCIILNNHKDPEHSQLPFCRFHILCVQTWVRIAVDMVKCRHCAAVSYCGFFLNKRLIGYQTAFMTSLPPLRKGVRSNKYVSGVAEQHCPERPTLLKITCKTSPPSCCCCSFMDTTVASVRRHFNEVHGHLNSLEQAFIAWGLMQHGENLGDKLAHLVSSMMIY
jgi:hypothetical protein